MLKSIFFVHFDIMCINSVICNTYLMFRNVSKNTNETFCICICRKLFVILHSKT